MERAADGALARLMRVQRIGYKMFGEIRKGTMVPNLDHR